MTPSITEDAVNTALGNLLTAMLPQLPAGNIIVGQVNRVASPEGDYVVMWPLRRPRLATNLDTPADCKFTGSIALTVMTVAVVNIGSVRSGLTVFGTNVTAGITIVNQMTGPTGGAGTYTITPSQSVAQTTLATGSTDISQSTEVVYQIDVHGPASADNSQTISTLFRDDFAVTQFSTEPISIAPLYADDPRQVPFFSAASQFEERWCIDVHLQISPVISAPTQFADSVAITLVELDVTYPAS